MVGISTQWTTKGVPRNSVPLIVMFIFSENDQQITQLTGIIVDNGGEVTDVKI